MTTCLEEAPADDLVAVVTAAITDAAMRAAARGEAGRALAELDLPSIIAEAAPVDGNRLLFAAGAAFGAIDPALAWRALVPALGGTPRLAIGSARHGWSLVEPVEVAGAVWLLDGMARTIALATAPGGVAGLLGFPAGGVRRFAAATAGVPLAAGLDVAPVLARHAALLLGLVAGAAREAVVTAFAYARGREVGGAPIAQYQAVALRLADLAINGRALDLFAGAVAVGQGGDDPDAHLTSAAASTVADLAFRIARDAVQTGGGHGYVAGLPPRRLFEQLRSLTGLLQTIVEAQAALRAEHEVTV